jgi:hypothetical protein
VGKRVADDGLRSLVGLTALTSINLSFCGQVTDNVLRELAGLTALDIIKVDDEDDY